MNRLYLTLEDGAVFEGLSVDGALEAAGLLSFYTGVVGYQEVVSDPANLGKIVLFTYPLIGNYGVNADDAESASVKVRGILTKEYPGYYSNFRATGSLADYVAGSAAFGTGFDTRAILLHLREHGEMLATVSTEPVAAADVPVRVKQSGVRNYSPENGPVPCAQERPRVKAWVADLGASRSFYRHLASIGVDACCAADQADLIVVSDAPYYAVEQQDSVDLVKAAADGRPVIGFGHGSSIAARAAGAEVRRLAFGDHGCNIPVKSAAGGRNEITVQNHIYEAVAGDGIEVLFENVHDGTCEGYVCRAERTAGVNFLPTVDWFELLLKSVGVE